MAKSKSLKKQLLKEIKSSPQKAAALGVLCLVGLYFWAPIAYRAVVKKSAAAPEMPAAGAGLPSPVSTTEGAAAAAEPVKRSWRERATWLDEHTALAKAPSWSNSETWQLPLGMTPVSWVAVPRRDPFAEVPRAKPRPVVASKRPVVRTSRPPLSVRALGLRLDSTAVGPRQRSALINGRVYRQGSTVPARGGVNLVLRTVEPRRAVLELDGQTLELKIERASLAAATPAAAADSGGDTDTEDPVEMPDAAAGEETPSDTAAGGAADDFQPLADPTEEDEG